MKPTKHQFTLLRQVMSNIPAYLVSSVARAYGVDKRSRTFTSWSHVVAMVYAQLNHALSLNDVCDALSTVRNAAPPMSHANRTRDAGMAKALFDEMLLRFTSMYPKFGRSGAAFKLPRRMKRALNLLDSTTVHLVANCMDWAQHRRWKAAAKCHINAVKMLKSKSTCVGVDIIRPKKLYRRWRADDIRPYGFVN